MRDLFLNFLILNAKKIRDLSRAPFGVCLNRAAGKLGKDQLPLFVIKLPGYILLLFSVLFVRGVQCVGKSSVDTLLDRACERLRVARLLRTRFKPFSFRNYRNPSASIIIPVYNKWLFTSNCLRSILENTKGIPYEVVVVDNNSQDKTKDLLAKIGHLKVLRNHKNVGFIRACNQGASVARGKFLVFLNNDTLVQPHWLKELLGTFETNNRVGAVGSKLLYPNGLLQEAGGIIWSDASGWNYGRGDDPTKPEYNFVREVDYCSGACLTIPRSLFVRFGGFDKQYEPAYYEDTDLCFRLRSSGYKVLYQPKAEIIHFEGITAGTDLSSGAKAYQLVNREKFRKRWKQVLKDKHYSPERPELRWHARRPTKKREILIIDHQVPTPDQDSGSFRMWSIIEILGKLGFAITLYPNDLRNRQPYTGRLQQRGVEVIYGGYEFGWWLQERVGQFDLVLLSRPTSNLEKLAPIARYLPNAKLIYDTVDLHFLREERRYAITGDPEASVSARWYRRIELFLGRASDITFVVTEQDKKAFLKLDPKLKIEVIPNIHPMPQGTIPSFEDRSGLFFLGGFLHLPNIDAVLWFVKKIFPLVKKGSPQIRFYVAGSNMPPRIKRLGRLPGIEVLGWLPDVAPVFKRRRILICPLRYGSGMKGKLGQAMSYGLPVVTTSIGAEGMDLKDGESALIADDPVGFAKKIINLYRNKKLWENLSRNSVSHVKENWTPQIVQKKLEETLHKLQLSS